VIVAGDPFRQVSWAPEGRWVVVLRVARRELVLLHPFMHLKHAEDAAAGLVMDLDIRAPIEREGLELTTPTPARDDRDPPDGAP
jgi:hypothetical protein